MEDVWDSAEPATVLNCSGNLVYHEESFQSDELPLSEWLKQNETMTTKHVTYPDSFVRGDDDLVNFQNSNTV
jgi:hypothetical protein